MSVDLDIAKQAIGELTQVKAERDACLKRLEENDAEIERLTAELDMTVSLLRDVRNFMESLGKSAKETEAERDRLRTALMQAEGALRMMEHAYDTQNRPNVMMLRAAFKAIREISV